MLGMESCTLAGIGCKGESGYGCDRIGSRSLEVLGLALGQFFSVLNVGLQ